MFDFSFYKNKKVLITGNTGFKGSWMQKLLLSFGAEVYGYALRPEEESLYNICSLDKEVCSCIGDIRDLDRLKSFFDKVKPDIVIHMAAQPLVRRSYSRPVYTYDVNVMGTVNVLECIRNCESVAGFVNVTTDKVYLNRERREGYKEEERLCGFDPYSNSKSCSELVSYSYANSFFADRDMGFFTARAGNVIGGGDFAEDRIIPDCYRAAAAKENVNLRNPLSVRPYQHVLEPVTAYLEMARRGYGKNILCENYNVGPGDRGCVTTGELAGFFLERWNDNCGTDIRRVDCSGGGGPHEANFLRLDCDKILRDFGIKPVWSVKTAARRAADWYRRYNRGKDVNAVVERDIEDFMKDREKVI